MHVWFDSSINIWSSAPDGILPVLPAIEALRFTFERRRSSVYSSGLAFIFLLCISAYSSGFASLYSFVFSLLQILHREWYPYFVDLSLRNESCDLSVLHFFHSMHQPIALPQAQIKLILPMKLEATQNRRCLQCQKSQR